MGVLRIVVVLPALFTRKEVELGSGTIHESCARVGTRVQAYTHPAPRRVSESATKLPACVRKCTDERGAVCLMRRVYVRAYVSRKNVIQGSGCASVTRNSVRRPMSADLPQRFSNFPTLVVVTCFSYR